MSFKFNTEQTIYDLAGAKIGGQPGENPTFLIGSIFWLGEKMVTDANKGIFDAKAAEQIINTCQTQSDITGVKFCRWTSSAQQKPDSKNTRLRTETH